MDKNRQIQSPAGTLLPMEHENYLCERGSDIKKRSNWSEDLGVRNIFRKISMKCSPSWGGAPSKHSSSPLWVPAPSAHALDSPEHLRIRHWGGAGCLEGRGLGSNAVGRVVADIYRGTAEEEATGIQGGLQRGADLSPPRSSLWPEEPST